MPISVEYRPALTTAGVLTRVELDGWAAGEGGPGGTGTLDAHGSEWGLGTDSSPGGVEGWQTSPGIRLSHRVRPGEHGVFDGPAQMTERVIMLEGSCRSADFNAAQRSRDILVSVMGDSQLGMSTLTVYEQGRPTKQARVRRSAESKTLWLSDTFFLWSMILVAPDPRRYAAAESTQAANLPGAGTGGLVFPLVFPLTFGSGAAGGSLLLDNSGTIATPVVWEILGPVDAPVITNIGTGQRLEFASTFSLGSGETVTINSDTKTVLQGVTNRRPDLVVAQWWNLATGPNQIQFSGASGSPTVAQLTATWRDAWT